MKILKKILGVLAVFTVLSVLFFIGGWVYFAKQLDVSKITDVNQTISLFDKNDEYVTGVYSEQNRTKIDIEELPQTVKNAFIAIEDERFYSHKGIDIKRICGAAIKNIKTGGISEGASTIPQQLIKLSHLSSQKKLSRKIKEAFLALELERRYSKDDILEMYLNYCYFGNGAYGIEAGARRYFGISAKELSTAQSAMLAGILKSPSKFAPHRDLQKSIERRNLVLKQMKACGFISENEYNSAVSELPTLTESAYEPYPYGYYIDTVLYETEQILGIDAEDLQKEGYRIYTNLDKDIQSSLEQATAITLPDDSLERAMTMLSSKGEIVAITGGKAHTARRGINRSMDTKRSPGSAIKPVIVYAPAYEQKNYTNATFVLDEKREFNGYSPSNSSDKYHGWVTTKKALALSLNVPAVKILNEVGVENAKEYCKSVGIEFEQDDNHLALALGGFSKGITPLQLSAAYVPFTNGGSYFKPTAIRRIETKDGYTIYQADNAGEKVLSEETAFLMTDMLKEVVYSGTGKKLQSLGFPIAAKTGTSNIQGTNKNKDAWLVGCTADYVCTAWVGYDSGAPLPMGVSGGTYPAMMVESVFLEIYKNKEVKDFEMPEGIVKVMLDKKTLELQKKPVIAGEFTTNSETVAEYFSFETMPKEYADLTSKAPPVKDFSVYIGENGFPIVSFKPVAQRKKEINYTIMRMGEDGQVPIYQTSEQKETVLFEDTNTQKGKSYRYYIVAMYDNEHAESEKIEIKLE